MQTQAVEIIETEVPLEKVMSLNHSRLIGRISYLLTAAYEDKFDVLPELEFELSHGNLKPDVAILPHQTYEWQQDVIRFGEPPITAIEILSPTQAFDAVASKIWQQYLPAGVKSAWLVVPFVKTIHLFLPGNSITTFSTGKITDPACGVELELATIFR